MREFIIFKYKIWEAKARQKKKSSLKKKSPKNKTKNQGSILPHSGPDLTKSPGLCQTPSNSPASASEALGLQMYATKPS